MTQPITESWKKKHESFLDTHCQSFIDNDECYRFHVGHILPMLCYSIYTHSKKSTYTLVISKGNNTSVFHDLANFQRINDILAGAQIG